MTLGRSAGDRLFDRIRQTTIALRLVIARRDALGLTVGITIGYLITYLWAAQDLSLRTDMDRNLLIVNEPFNRMWGRTGPASFEAVAILDTGIVRWLVSPLNFAIGATLAILVGVSLALAYLAVVQPQACGLGASSGFFAAVPALLSGTVCCGPVILLAIGLQATGLMMTIFGWLLPIGVVLLVGSVIYLAGKIDVATDPSEA